MHPFASLTHHSEGDRSRRILAENELRENRSFWVLRIFYRSINPAGISGLLETSSSMEEAVETEMMPL